MIEQNLTIYHTNDVHNRNGIFDLLSEVKRNGNTLLLDAGDAIAGSSTLFFLREVALEKMNKANYDAITMGNRELNYIRWVLKIRAKQAKFPILTANLKDLTGRSDGFYKSYIIRELGNIKVGIFGLTPVQYDDNSLWLSLLKFRFLDPFMVSRKMAEELKNEVDLLILLSHLGAKDDTKIAETTRGIDLIIGGHSHTILQEPLHINDTYIFQAGCHGALIGKIDLTVAPGSTPKIKSINYELLKTVGRHID